MAGRTGPGFPVGEVLQRLGLVGPPRVPLVGSLALAPAVSQPQRRTHVDPVAAMEDGCDLDPGPATRPQRGSDLCAFVPLTAAWSVRHDHPQGRRLCDSIVTRPYPPAGEDERGHRRLGPIGHVRHRLFPAEPGTATPKVTCPRGSRSLPNTEVLGTFTPRDMQAGPPAWPPTTRGQRFQTRRPTNGVRNHPDDLDK